MSTEDPIPSTGAVEDPATAGSADTAGWFKRKKRAWIGKIVSNLVGENPPPSNPEETPAVSNTYTPAAGSIRDDIEENGLFGGIGNRIKRTADSYIKQKLDEIEQRIDHKLDEIDQRLSEWRDREIANRIRILKITLWASVIVAIVSLIYSWLRVYFLRS